MTKKAFALLLASSLVLSTAACSQGEAASSAPLEVQEDGTVDLTGQSFTIWSPIYWTGKVSGFAENEAWQELQKRLGVELTFYGYVGDIVDVNPAPVIDVLEQGYIPVVSTVAQGIDDETNYNINADTAACKLAVALGAKKLILLTDVRGLMLDPDDESTLLTNLKVSEVPKLMRDGVIKGGMIPKVDCCVEAVRKGVDQANIQDGRVKHSILIELLSKVGVGTMFQ